MCANWAQENYDETQYLSPAQTSPIRPACRAYNHCNTGAYTCQTQNLGSAQGSERHAPHVVSARTYFTRGDNGRRSGGPSSTGVSETNQLAIDGNPGRRSLSREVDERALGPRH